MPLLCVSTALRASAITVLTTLRGGDPLFLCPSYKMGRLMRPSTVSCPLFYSYASNPHVHVREAAGVHLLNSGLEAKRQQLDPTLQRPRDTRPHDCISQGGFGWFLHSCLPPGAPRILGQTLRPSTGMRGIAGPEPTPRRAKKADQPIFSFLLPQARSHFLSRKVVLGLKRREVKNSLPWPRWLSGRASSHAPGGHRLTPGQGICQGCGLDP